MKNGRLFLVALLVATFGLSAWADVNWPTFRGPAGTGVSSDAKPPVKWSESKNVKWKIELPGDGNSSPIVWQDKIFLQTAVPADDEQVKFDLLCVNRTDGSIVWQQTASQARPHEGHHSDHGYASFSPVTDGKHVWINYGSQGVYCYDFSGRQVWKAPMPQMQTRRAFGEGSSPALAGDMLIVVADQERNSVVYALDKRTGKEIWKKSRRERTNWTSPLVVTHGDRTQIVVGGTTFISYDPANGNTLWTSSGHTQNVIPTPIYAHGLIYCLSGFRGSMCRVIRPDDGSKVWEITEHTPYVPSGIVANGKFYFGSRNRVSVSCYNATDGKAHFKNQRLGESSGMYASPVAANGHIYFTGRDGVVIVIKDDGSASPVAQNTLDDRIDATPALVDNQIIIRGKEKLYCIADS